MAINVNDLLSYTRGNLGKPYVFGAAGPSTFDCSGLVTYVFKHFGVNLPHKSEDQAKLGTAVDKNNIQPGDLVFSDWGDGPNSHVGIAVSGQQIIDAPHTGAVVRYDDLNSTYRSHITAVRRIDGVGGTPATLAGAGTSSDGLLGGVLNLVIPDTVKQFFTDADQAAQKALWLFDPSHWVRIWSGLIGIILIGMGVFFLAREVRSA